jgi:thioesterase domain-containing protein/acyl carrier protein
LEKKSLELTRNFQPAKISVVSSVTGNTITINQTIDFEQWQKEFDFTKNNVKNLPNSLLDSSQILLDICSIQIKNFDIKTIDDYNINSNNLTSLFSTLIKFWLMGIKIDWSKVEDYKQCYPISLPTYPFERQSYWINVLPTILNNQIANNQHKLEQLDQEFVAPRNEIEQQLANIWQQVLGHKSIGIHDNFFELGGSSLLAGRLFVEIEKVLKIKMPTSAIFQAPTIEKLAKILRSEVKISDCYSLIPLQPQGSYPILFGIHWLKYRDLSRKLGLNQPIYGLYYGMGDTTGSIISLPKIEDLAKHYIEEIQSLQPEGPYFLMGLSRGGTIAFEMAQQLISQNQKVALLVMFDTDLIKGKITFYPPAQRLLNKSWMMLDYIWRLGFAEFANRIKIRIKIKFRPLISKYFPSVNLPKPLLSINDEYIPKPYGGQVLFFRATKSYPDCYIDFPEEEWKQLVKGKLEIVDVPGNHNSILEEPHVQILAEKIKSQIDLILKE